MVTAQEGQPFSRMAKRIASERSTKSRRIILPDPARPNGRNVSFADEEEEELLANFAEVRRKVVEAPKVGFVSFDCSRFF